MYFHKSVFLKVEDKLLGLYKIVLKDLKKIDKIEKVLFSLRLW